MAMFSEMFDALRRMPDSLAEAIQEYGETPDEICVGCILRLHRDWLHDGFELVLENLRASDLDIASYVTVYEQLGLSAEASIWVSATELARQSLPSEEWDILDDRYAQLVYGPELGETDLLEMFLVEYVHQHRAAFTQSLAVAGK